MTAWRIVPVHMTPDMQEAVVTLDFTATHDPLWPEYWATLLEAAPVPAKPFSTYPEDRAKLLDLARRCEQSDDAYAIELGDLVRAILEDEAVLIASAEAL